MGYRWRDFLSDESTVRKALRAHRDNGPLRNALRGYSRALSDWDPDAAFIRLWSVFELLASGASNQRLPHKKLERRALFMLGSGEGSFFRYELRFLSDRRNKIAHRPAPDGAADPDVSLQQLRAWVDGLLRYHLFEVPTKRSFQEAAQLLELPRNTSDLHREVEDRNWALATRRQWRGRLG